MIGELKPTVLKARLAAVGYRQSSSAKVSPSGWQRYGETVAVRKSAGGGQVGTVCDVYYKVRIDFGRRYMGYMLWCHYDP
jgi:hypothetical protein